MANATKNKGTEAATEAVKPKRPKVDRKLRERVNLLKTISEKYKDLAAALNSGDDVAFASAYDLIETYQDLFAKLSQESANAVTAEGLADANEM